MPDPIVTLTGFLGQNTKRRRRFLPEPVGVLSLNQKPSDRGDFRPWRAPLAVSGPVFASGRQTIYRMSADVRSSTQHWLGWNTVAHAIRGFDASDPSERTYFTGSGTPKWTDNIIGLSSTPYPNGTRELAVPAPVQTPPTPTLVTDGATGDARRIYYVFTWVNDLGWESAPSPPVLAPEAKPGAIIGLTVSETPPAGSYGINRLRWYRTQTFPGALAEAEFFFLREYATGATGMQDDARALGEQLGTEGWDALPSTAKGLTACWNQFAAAIVGKSVRFCEPGFIYAWPLDYEYRTKATPVALAVFGGRLVCLTTAGALVYTGQHPDSMDEKPMALAPCVAERAVASTDEWVAWAGADGAYYLGPDGSRCITEDVLEPEQWQAMNPSSMVFSPLFLGRRGFVFGTYNDGTSKGFVVDVKTGEFYALATGYDAHYWDRLQRKLFVLSGTALSEWDAGATNMTATFRSKVFRKTTREEAMDLEILSTGQATVRIFTEDASQLIDTDAPLVQRFERAVGAGIHKVTNGLAGRDWQVEIVTTGTVEALGIE